jgi:hypothetical protein
VRDEARGGLAKSFGVAARANMEEDAHGGDGEQQAAKSAERVPDPREAAARSQALGGPKEPEREETRGDDSEGQPPVPPLENLREGAFRPERATSLEDRDPRGKASDHDVHDSAREKTEARERTRDPLLLSAQL